MKKIYAFIFSLFTMANTFAQDGCTGWPANYGGVMLQGFSWDSYDYSQWKILEAQADEMSGFIDFVWVPQSGRCFEDTQVMGYTPYYYFNQNSSFGTEAELRSMIKTFKEKNINTMADVVINHHNTDGWFNFPEETYQGETYQLLSTDICQNDDNGKTATEAKAEGVSLSQNNDEGEDWDGCRDLDHKSENVQRVIKAYVKYLKEDLGYEGFRYDMVKGFNGSHVGDYNDEAGIEYSVGECWDSNNVIKSWINATGKKSAAFDFQFRYNVRDAINNNDWSKLKSTNNLISDNDFRRYAVTFVENHDMQDRGTSNNYSPDPIKKDTLAANAYMLAMPGTPCIFQPHWRAYKDELKSMIEVRKFAGINNMSNYTNQESQARYYANIVGGSKYDLLVVVGTTSMYNAPTGYTKVLSGKNFAYFLDNNAETAWSDKTSGTYQDAFVATLAAVSKDSNAKIVYTLDGSTPTSASQQAENGKKIDITESCILTVGLLVNGKVSGIRSYNYTFQTFEPYTFKVYVNVDRVGWDNVNFHTWSSNDKNNSGNWPGARITSTTTINDKTWYYKEYSIDSKEDVVNFVFSTGSGTPQTLDKTGVTNTAFFEISEKKSGGKYLINDVTSDMTTGINNIPTYQSASKDKGWYGISGTRYNVRPTQKGIYIYQGKKYIVK